MAMKLDLWTQEVVKKHVSNLHTELQKKFDEALDGDETEAISELFLKELDLLNGNK